jgi:uncharacterized protein (TIGR02246 family)
VSFSGPPADRLEIRELIETYADAVIRRDARAWIDTWAEDARWDLRNESSVGREAILALWQRKMQRFSFVAFTSSVGDIEVRGESATARVHVTEELWLEPEGFVRVHGRYDDELVQREGRWLFARRSYTVLRQITPPRND